jgi:RHS repeat-associated protein
MTVNVSGPLAPQTFTYDAENRITGAGGYTYIYDDEGSRVEKSNGSTGTIYWYMSPGIVAESSLTGALTSEYVFFNGERVARKDYPSDAVSYYFSDHLKTAAVITNSAGTITEDEDYYPWGGEIWFVNGDSNHYKFTGKIRDTETGLDYFGARYYGNWTGRFLSADWSEKPEAVPYSDLDDPQSLNLYSYVRNVPTSKTDPDGHSLDDCTVCDHDSGYSIAGTPGTETGLVLCSSCDPGQSWNPLPTPTKQCGCDDDNKKDDSKKDDSKEDDSKKKGNEKAKQGEGKQGQQQNQAQQKPTSPNQMQKQVEQGKAPKTIDRVDKGIGPHEKDHVHFSDGSALNSDGTWKHGSHTLTNAEKGWLQQNGWSLPTTK